MSSPVISVAHLSKRYGEFMAVADVSFEVKRGEIFGLLGPNGAGKTTSVECVQGLRTRDRGQVTVLGMDPRTDADHLRPLIGSQLQESSLPDRMKVWEALDLFAALMPNGPPWRQALDEWGLTEKAHSSFASLSGGQRQRLLVALALINEPQVVFLDEMTTGLDPAARRATWGLIERIRESGTTVVLVTHFMDEAERLCDRIAVVDQGEIVATGTPGELIASGHDQVSVRFTAGAGELGFLDVIPGVTSVMRRGNTVEVIADLASVPFIGNELVAHDLAPPDMRVVSPSLEDVYLRLVSGDED